MPRFGKVNSGTASEDTRPIADRSERQNRLEHQPGREIAGNVLLLVYAALQDDNAPETRRDGDNQTKEERALQLYNKIQDIVGNNKNSRDELIKIAEGLLGQNQSNPDTDVNQRQNATRRVGYLFRRKTLSKAINSQEKSSNVEGAIKDGDQTDRPEQVPNRIPEANLRALFAFIGGKGPVAERKLLKEITENERSREHVTATKEAQNAEPHEHVTAIVNAVLSTYGKEDPSSQIRRLQRAQSKIKALIDQFNELNNPQPDTETASGEGNNSENVAKISAHDQRAILILQAVSRVMEMKEMALSRQEELLGSTEYPAANQVVEQPNIATGQNSDGSGGFFGENGSIGHAEDIGDVSQSEPIETSIGQNPNVEDSGEINKIEATINVLLARNDLYKGAREALERMKSVLERGGTIPDEDRQKIESFNTTDELKPNKFRVRAMGANYVEYIIEGFGENGKPLVITNIEGNITFEPPIDDEATQAKLTSMLPTVREMFMPERCIVSFTTKTGATETLTINRDQIPEIVDKVKSILDYVDSLFSRPESKFTVYAYESAQTATATKKLKEALEYVKNELIDITESGEAVVVKSAAQLTTVLKALSEIHHYAHIHSQSASGEYSIFFDSNFNDLLKDLLKYTGTTSEE